MLVMVVVDSDAKMWRFDGGSDVNCSTNSGNNDCGCRSSSRINDKGGTVTTVTSLNITPTSRILLATTS